MPLSTLSSPACFAGLHQTQSRIPKFWIRVSVVASHVDRHTFALAALNLIGRDDGDVYLHRFFLHLFAALGANKVRNIDADSVGEAHADVF